MVKIIIDSALKYTKLFKKSKKAKLNFIFEETENNKQKQLSSSNICNLSSLSNIDEAKFFQV